VLHHITGKDVRVADDELVADAARDAGRVLVDVGTGDGRAAYRWARADPSLLVIGIDPEWRRMAPVAGRAARRPERGGAANLVLLRAVAQDPPVALRGIADEVRVRMPWGDLLAGVVTGAPDVLGGLRALARPGAALQVLVGTDIWREPVPVEIRPLPELTPARVSGPLARPLRRAGWTGASARYLDEQELRAAGSSWSKRLSTARPDSRFLELTATAGPPDDGLVSDMDAD
jgi:16S rRNA (adenine(1408)-N(1))-methyltransferase